MRHLAFIALGSNLESPKRQIEQAFAAIDRIAQTRLLARSPLYRSEPISSISQPDYINAVASVETGLSPMALLGALLEIELSQGRVRNRKDAPRTLDLDLLLYDDLTLTMDQLHIPHPRMHERRFVLAPLCDIAPECSIPGHGSARKCLAMISGQPVEKLTDSEHAA